MNTQTVSVIEVQGRPVLRLTGTVDVFIATDLCDAARVVLDRGVDSVVDWENMESIDVSALQVLLALKAGLHAKGRVLRFENCPTSVAHILKVSGLVEIFGVVAQVAEKDS